MLITNYDDYLYTIDYTPTNGWRKYHLLFSDFRQEGWGNEAVERDTALRFVNSIQFKFASKINHETNHLFIDDLALIGGNITYSSNALYHRQNTVSMEGYAGMSLVNASFTNAGSSATTIHGWVLSGNVRGEDWGANGGDAVFESWNGAAGAIGQEVGGVVAGSDYKFLVQMSKHASFTGSVYLETVWLTSGSVVIQTNRTADIAPSITTADWPPSSHDTGWVEAPATAAKVRVQIRVAGVTAENVKAHDASVTGSQYADNSWYTTWIPGFSVSHTTNRAEGEYAARFNTTNTDWVAGMYVPPFGTGETVTNFADYTGIAVKARRAPGYAGTGGTHGRIRMSVVTGSTETAKTRWYPVDGSEWEDHVIFSKDNFYTVETADTNDPAALVVWTNDWRAIDRVDIYYGPSTNGATPYDLILDDFRPCSGTYLH